ncbi:hypothetical protein ACROYT_G036461 [Oculina patagonica]
MDPHLIQTLTETLQRIGQQQQTSIVVPETIKIQSFRGQEGDDVVEWFDVFENRLKRRRIALKSEGALTELVLHLAGPAKDFYRNLNAGEKTTFEQVKQIMIEHYSSMDLGYGQREYLLNRRQAPNETLDHYLNDICSKFNRLDLTNKEKMSYFLQGLRPEIRQLVYMNKPTTFAEAEKATRFAESISRVPQPTTSGTMTDQLLAKLLTQKATKDEDDILTRLDTLINGSKIKPEGEQQTQSLLSKLGELVKRAENTATRQTQDTAIAAYSAENQESRILRKEMKELQESLLSIKQDLDPRVIGNSTDVSISRVPTNRPAAVAALNDTLTRNTGNASGIRDEIHQLKDMIKELGREVYARRPVLTETEPYGNKNSIAAFSETNRSGAPEFTEEIRRMENTFRSELENLYRRVDNRINSLVHRNQISRPELADSRLRNRQSNPVCYKCGRVGHIQYNCYYYYRPEDPYQNKGERQDYRADYNQEGNPQQELQSSASLLALDAQYARHVQDYHHKPESPRSEAQTSRHPVRTYSLTFEGEENSSDQVIAALPKQEKTNSQEADVNIPGINQKVKSAVTNEQQSQLMPKQGQSHKRTRRETKSSVQPSNVLLLRGKDVNLTSSDLTTAGKIAGQAVQLLVDTGACVSAIDEQFFTKIYGQFPPKLSDDSLSSVQTFNGDTVPVLGKITVPLQLNGHEYFCEFHVMQSLAYDAILGRDFLQKNGALINLVDSTICFSTATHPGKHTSTTTVPVMGTFLARQKKLKEKTAVATPVVPTPSQKSIQPNCKLAHRSQKNKEIGFQQPLRILLLMLVVLYLLTASCTPCTKVNAKPVVQKIPKFFVQKAPDNKIQDGRVFCTHDQDSQVNRRSKDPDSEIDLHESKLQRMKVLTSAEPFKETDLNNQESPLKMNYSPYCAISAAMFM